MKKICSIILCIMMLFAYIPAGMADEGLVGSNADLSNLSVASSVYYDLAPAFEAATDAYTVNVPNEVSSVDITATTADTLATLEINGAAATSGSAQTVSGLAEGDNPVAVAVTAADGATVKTYTLNIKRAEAAGETNPLPQTPAAYAASDYAKYGSRMATGYAHIAVINASGTLVAGGDNTYGQCDVPADLAGVKVKAVAAGYYHTLALTEDGRVFAWGSASGSGAVDRVSIPDEVTAVQGDIKLIAAGSQVSAVVTNTNKVIVWGVDEWNLQNVPDGLGNIVTISIGYNCTVVLNDEGNVSVWGNSSCTTIPDGLSGNVVAIEAGMNHWLALKKDGTVSVTGASAMLNVCQKITTQTDVRAIAGGWQFAGAILADGSVKGWGRTMSGTKKDGIELIPASVNIKAFVCTNDQGIGNASAVCAMQEDGTIKIAAPSDFVTTPITNNFNFLTTTANNAALSSLTVTNYDISPAFDANTTSYTVNVSNETTSVEITAVTVDSNATLKINGTGAASGSAQTISNLVEGDNTVTVTVTSADLATVKDYILRINRATATLNNNASLSSLVVANFELDPVFSANTTSYTVNVSNETTSVEITAVTAGNNASLKINGATAVSGTPQTVDNLAVGANAVTVEVTAQDGTTVITYTITVTRAGKDNSMPQTPAAYAASDYGRLGKRMATGLCHAAVVLADGTVAAWGDDTYGQLEAPGEATGVKALAASSYHTLALKEDGGVVAWGQNIKGQCDIPAELSGCSVKDIAAGGTYSAALTGDNRIYLWGGINTALESEKELVSIGIGGGYLLVLAGDGTVAAWRLANDSASPCDVPENFSGGVVAISAGSFQHLALKADGSVVEWNNDSYPVPAGLTTGRAVSATQYVSAALNQAGEVTVWGKDNYGLLGVPDVAAGVLALAGGYRNLCVLKQDGTVTVWGDNTYGQCEAPEGLNLFTAFASGNTNLSSLSIESVIHEGGVLKNIACGIYPELSRAQTEGIADVAYDTEEVRITARTYSSAATLEINGEAVQSGEAVVINGSELEVGDNPIPIKVTAAAGNEWNGALRLKRVAAAYSLPQTPRAYQESEFAAYGRRIAAGSGYSMVIKNDGTVAAWGDNIYGQCNVPVYLDNVVDIAGGYYNGLALQADGTVTAVGRDDEGQCDLPDYLNDVADISAGSGFFAALDAEGKVYVWGNNTSGQCDIPAELNKVADIECGGAHVLALQEDGAVKAWGRNDYGQCDVPADLNNVVAIAAGSTLSMALKADGTLVTWGKTGDYKRDFEHPDLRYVKAITIGEYFAAALKWDGSLVAWGSYQGQETDISVPLKLDQEILAICSGQRHLLGLKKDGTVAAWKSDQGGSANSGQCEIPPGLNLFTGDTPYAGESPDIPQTPEDYAASDYAVAAAKICNVAAATTGIGVLNMDGTVKVIIPGGASDDAYGLREVPEDLSNVKAIAAPRNDSYNIMALTGEGKVEVWGDNGGYQCEVPAGLADVTAIAIGYHYVLPCCLALKADGTVTAWGGNEYGQCDIPAGLANVTAVAAGGGHCLALKSDGTVVAWGDNAYGQCDVPPGLKDVARIYAGDEYSLALKEDGTVAAWGSNYSPGHNFYCGQCDVPEGLSGVVDIALDSYGCAALKSNGTVVVWGNNTYGRRNVPAGLHDIAAVSFGEYGVTAVKTDGSVVLWGKRPSLDEERLTGLSNVLTIANLTQTVIFRDGTLYNYADEQIDDGLAGLNVLSGHYFNIVSAELLNPAGQSISSVPVHGGYRIKASVANNNTTPTAGLTIIQVRSGSGAGSSGGGRVLGCVGLAGEIPVSGSTVSSDFTMPAGISEKAYVDVFVWDGWDTMVPRAEANQDLNFSVTQ